MIDKKAMRETRINAMKILYNMDLMKNSLDVAASDVFSEENIDEASQKLANDVLAHQDEIKDVIEKCLTNYSLNRLSYVDRAIVMIAVHEMLIGVPFPIVINEALEITKEFSNLDDDKAKAFNNRLLDTIAKYIEAMRG